MLLDLISRWIEPIDLSRVQLRSFRWRANRRTLLDRYLLLALILIVGAGLRFTGHNWDQGTLLHPDERFLVTLMPRTPLHSGLSAPGKDQAEERSAECLAEYEASGQFAANCTNLEFTTNYNAPSIAEQTAHCLRKYPRTAGAGSFLDTACSPANPRNAGAGHFAYGTLPLFLMRTGAELVEFVERLLGMAGAGHIGAIEIKQVGRAISSLLDTLSIFFLFLIGQQLHSRRAGLLAAAFYAFAPFPIQLSHFATFNATAAFFVVLALWFGNRIVAAGKLRDYTGYGFATAAALACRINLLPLLGILALAFVIRVWQNWRIGEEAEGWGNSQLRNVAGLLLSVITCLFFFRIFNPYTFVGPALISGINERWWLDFQQTLRAASGQSDAPPNWQWAGRLSYFHPLKDILLWGLGLAAGIPALLGISRNGIQWLLGRRGSVRFLLLLAWVVGYFGYFGGAWVMTMRYFIPIYGALVVFAASFAWDAYDWLRRKEFRIRSRASSWPAPLWIGCLATLSLLWGVMFHNIYRQTFTRIQGSAWIQTHVPADLTLRMEEAPPESPLVNVAFHNRGGGGDGDESLRSRSTIIPDSSTIEQNFYAPASGRVTGIYLPHIGRVTPGESEILLRIDLLDETGETLAHTLYNHNFPTDDHPLGNPHLIPLVTPVALEAGALYSVRLEALGDELYLGGSVVSAEGVWDDWLTSVHACQPALLAGRGECVTAKPIDAQILEYDMKLSTEDNFRLDEEFYKLENFLNGLSRSDYITISSNRFYDTQLRNPTRFPLTNAYYQHLFSGELGYELAASLVEGYEIGPLRVLDQHLPHHDTPAWLNHFEADEAYHVYDHPAVFIFRKTEAYDPQNARALLEAPSLYTFNHSPYLQQCDHLEQENELAFQCSTEVANYYRHSSLALDSSPSQLLYSGPQQAIQSEEASWNERFALDGLLNRQHGLALIAWWLVVWLLGMAAWPLLYYLMPAFADRGYGLARAAGMIGLSWLAWLLASAQLRVWNGPMLWLLLLLALLPGLALAWRSRIALRAFLSENWRKLLVIELLTLALFAILLLVRLSNPDLWVVGFGGEKMMNNAYLNGVARSEIFPPINPWFAGSYINYYYYGYVLAGVPTLMSGIMPSVAYNLIMPTIFTLAGIGAYSIAYHLAGRVRFEKARPALAGIAALCLLTLLGNLDTLHVWLDALHRLGQDRLAGAGGISLAALFEGLQAWLAGAQLPVGSDHWMWNPTRVISYAIGDNAITEFPFFTHLYGDLHAHALALPILILTLAFAAHELTIGRSERGGRWRRIVILAPWAIACGLSWATNSWDWFSVSALSLVAIALAWWRRYDREEESALRDNWRARLSTMVRNRAAILELALFAGGFLVLNILATAPYRAWFASTSTAFEIWNGPFTPIFPYLRIHGHFLFLLIGVLLIISRRQLGSWRNLLQSLQPMLLAILLCLIAAALILQINGRSLLILLLPLSLWIALLLLREKYRSESTILLFAGLALALTLAPELMRLQMDIGRQNTVFKLYYVSWLFFSIIGGVALAILWSESRRWGRRLRFTWLIPTVALFLIALAYPLLATPNRAAQRFDDSIPISLDGLAFMRYAHHQEADERFPLAPDLEIIHWLQENVDGAPVIIEGRTWGSEYRWNGRISSHTGLPSPLGWQFHQQQQRTFWAMSELIQRRGANITGFYTTPDADAALHILRAYDVEYIILGPLEHALYDRADETDSTKYVDGYTKFDELVANGALEVVFETPYQYESAGEEYPAVARILRVVAE